LDALLADRELRALVCRGGTNFTYLTEMAMPGTLGRHLDTTDSARDAFVVWPAEGDPVVVVTEIAAAYVRANARTARTAIYRDYRDSPAAALVSALDDLGIDSGRVGFDVAWFGASRWRELLSQLPRITAVDCTADLDEVRADKSAAEVERIREASIVLDTALEDVLTNAHIGESERDVHARIVERGIELGAAHVHGIFQVSSNEILYGGESEHRILPGDLVRTDYVAYVDGYASNLSRLLHAGEPTQTVLDRYQAYLRVYRSAAELLRDGAIGGTVHSQIQTLLAAEGFESGMPLSGHGIGCWLPQQPPMLVDSSQDRLRAGMVIALEPVGGHWHLQDQFLITDGAPLRLSDRFELETLPWIE
jgi:Xaa-Pro aminopeptidase